MATWFDTFLFQASQMLDKPREQLTPDDGFTYLERAKLIGANRRTTRDLVIALQKAESQVLFKNASNRIKFNDQYQSLVQKIGSLNAQNWRQEQANAVELLKANKDLYNDSLRTLHTPDYKFVQGINKAKDASAMAGTITAERVIRLYATGVGEGEVPFFDPTKSTFPATFRRFAYELNHSTGAEAPYVRIDPATGVASLDEEGLDKIGVKGAQYEALEDVVENYNREQPNITAAIKAGQEGYEQAELILERAGSGEIDWSQAVEEAKSVIEGVPNVLDDYLITVRDAKVELDGKQQIQREIDEIRDENERLSSGDRKRNDSSLGRAIADPKFRAWAVDHGFDNLSVVPLNEDGTPNVSAYAPGGDDLMAKAAYEKEYRLGPGKYGFGRRAITGEVVQVTLADGSRIFGDRLKYHAGDEPGTVRVVTEDGKIQVIPPKGLKQVVVVERDEKKLTWLERRATRIARRRGEKYGAAAASAMIGDPEEMVGSATTETGDYIRDSKGNYVKQDDYDKQVDDYIESQSVTYYGRGGEHFIETQPDGKMYQVSSVDGSLTLLDETNDDDIKKIDLVRSEKPRRTTITKDGKLIPLTRGEFEEMIKAGKMDASLGAEAFPGEPNYEQGIFERLEAAYADRRKAVTPEDVGFTSTPDRPDPFSGQELINRRKIGDVEYADLAEQPETPLPEDYTDPTEAEDQISADETKREKMLEAQINRITAADEEEESEEEGSEEEMAQEVRAIFDADDSEPEAQPSEKGFGPLGWDLSAEGIFSDGGPKREGDITLPEIVAAEGVAPKEAAPKEAAPKEAATKEAATKEAAPKDTTPKKPKQAKSGRRQRRREKIESTRDETLSTIDSIPSDDFKALGQFGRADSKLRKMAASDLRKKNRREALRKIFGRKEKQPEPLSATQTPDPAAQDAGTPQTSPVAPGQAGVPSGETPLSSIKFDETEGVRLND